MTEGKNSQVNYLNEQILKEICHEMARRYFQQEEPMGMYEDHDQGKVDASLNLPQQSAFGQELYPTIYKKAAVTFYAFNRNHAFGNGNKRLSVMAFTVFLFMNDRALTVTANELRDKALWIAQTDMPIGEAVEELATWAERNTLTMAEWFAAHPEAEELRKRLAEEQVSK